MDKSISIKQKNAKNVNKINFIIKQACHANTNVVMIHFIIIQQVSVKNVQSEWHTLIKLKHV